MSTRTPVRLDGNTGIRFTGVMKATMELPDDLYRQVKAKSALEGRPVREVAIELFRRYVGLGEPSECAPGDREAGRQLHGEPVPEWFGILRQSARRVKRHDLAAIRESIAKGVAADRRL